MRRHEATRLVSITLDPQYETPFAMSRYARGLEAHAPDWRLASGSLAAVGSFLNAFGVMHGESDVHLTFV